MMRRKFGLALITAILAAPISAFAKTKTNKQLTDEKGNGIIIDDNGNVMLRSGQCQILLTDSSIDIKSKVHTTITFSNGNNDVVHISGKSDEEFISAIRTEIDNTQTQITVIPRILPAVDHKKQTDA